MRQSRSASPHRDEVRGLSLPAACRIGREIFYSERGKLNNSINEATEMVRTAALKWCRRVVFVACSHRRALPAVQKKGGSNVCRALPE